MRVIEREQRHRQREKQAPCGEPNMELYPRTLGSQPEPKTDAQPLSHPGIPSLPFFLPSSLLWGLPPLGVPAIESTTLGCLSGSAVEHLPLAQGVIPGSWDRVPHRAPCVGSASPSAYVSASLSLCVTIINK